MSNLSRRIQKIELKEMTGTELNKLEKEWMDKSALSPCVEAEISLAQDDIKAAFSNLLQKHKERLAYNAAYQRDLRTIKRLGLNCTVAVYRSTKQGDQK